QDGYLRLSMVRIAALCVDCSSLLLSTREFFNAWQQSLQSHIDTKQHLTSKELDDTYRIALEGLNDARVLQGIRDAQIEAFKSSVVFCHDLFLKTDAVRHALSNLFSLASASPDYVNLQNALKHLRATLTDLQRVHLADGEPGEYPSIRDASRFQ